ncbi:hypothetical protein GCM10020295_73130 [Streptomyces cinereospinus]
MGGTVVLGWAIVYWPHMPAAFTFSPGSEAAQEPALLDSVYLSLVTVATLGLGGTSRPAKDGCAWSRRWRPSSASPS